MSLRTLSRLLLAATTVWACIAPVHADECPVPVLDCTVQCAHGYFSTYTHAPVKDDKVVLDLRKYMLVGKNDLKSESTMLQFSSGAQAVVELPLKETRIDLNPGKRTDKEHYSDEISCRFESSTRRGTQLYGTRIDVRHLKDQDWQVFYTYELDGVTMGSIVMTGTRHPVPQHSPG